MNQTRNHRLILSVTLVTGMILTSSVFSKDVENLLMDPDFEEPVLGWNLARRAPAAATLTIDTDEKKVGPASARIEITDVGAAGSVHALTLDNQAAISVQANETYTVDFWTKAEADRPLILDALLNQGPWTGLFRVRDVPVTTEWTIIHHTFQANATLSPVVFLFSFVDSTTTIWLDHVRFYEGEFDEEDVSRDTAFNPIPAANANDVGREGRLSWTPGELANTHDVYFGTAFDDVNDASSAKPTDVLVSSGQDANSFDPGRLEFDQTYYWRIDEVNGAPDFAKYKGAVWSFTTEPFSIPVSNVTATASSSFGTSGPEKTIDGSGLVDDLHDASAGDMWISGGIPATIEYAFDRAYKLHEMWIWNSNQLIEAFVGFGAKDVVIEHSLDGENWTVLDGVGPLAQAPGTGGYAHNNTIDFGGAAARYVRMTINSVQGIAPQASLSEVRFFFIPTFATQPNPDSGATNVAPDSSLSWGRDGREAGSHDVYVGTDSDNLSLAGSVSESSFDTLALDLQLGQSYAWRVDEVNEAMDPSTWEGAAWSFTAADFIPIDDMEPYRDEEFFEIWATWVDGFDDTANGSLVGNGASGSPETGIVQGGNQSMPLHFDNTGTALSEATFTFDSAMDWTKHGVQSLSLYFQGASENSGGQLYVKINNTKIPYNGDAGDISGAIWWLWNIDLSNAGGDLMNVSSLTIGIEGAGAAGVVYIDDIRLDRLAP